MHDDTDPKARAHLTALYRRLTPDARMALCFQMADEGRALAISAIRGRHPEYSEAEANLALGRLWLGDAQFRKVRPDAPLLEP